MGTPKFWTPERLETLRQLHQANTPNIQIASIFGVTRHAVVQQKMLLKIRDLKSWTTECDEQLRALATAGATRAHMAATMGRTVGSINRRMFDLRLKKAYERKPLQRESPEKRAARRKRYLATRAVLLQERQTALESELERRRTRTRRMMDLSARLAFLKRWQKVIEAA